MREVAVTEGDKVEAQMKFGWSVNGYGIGELVAVIEQVTDKQVDLLCEQLESEYKIQDGLRKGGNKSSLRESARIEIGLLPSLKKVDSVVLRIVSRICMACYNCPDCQFSV